MYTIIKIILIFLSIFSIIIQPFDIGLDTLIILYISISILLFSLIYYDNKFMFKGWYLFLIFIVLYSLPHFIVMLKSGEDLLVRAASLSRIMNNSLYNVIAIKTILLIIGSMIIGSFFHPEKFSEKNKKYNSKHAKDYKIRKLDNYILSIVLLSLSLLAVLTIDWSKISDAYSLGSGFTILFGVVFIYQMVYLLNISKMIPEKNILTSNYVLFLIMMILFVLGIRQLVLWFIIGIALVYFYKRIIINNKKINFIYMAITAFSVLSITGLVVAYRGSKELSGVTLDSFLEYTLMGYVWEANFTLYNLFASIDLVETKNIDLFFLQDMYDFILLMIPQFIFPERNEYLKLISYKELYNLAPFGTYFIVGEIILSLRYKILIFIFSFSIGFFSEKLYHIITRSYNSLNLALYIYALIYLFIYPVRSTLPSGMKIFFLYGVSIYIFYRYKLRYGAKT